MQIEVIYLSKTHSGRYLGDAGGSGKVWLLAAADVLLTLIRVPKVCHDSNIRILLPINYNFLYLVRCDRYITPD